MHWYELELAATDNLTLERINRRCPVVGTWKNGFIARHAEGCPRLVGKTLYRHEPPKTASPSTVGEQKKMAPFNSSAAGEPGTGNSQAAVSPIRRAARYPVAEWSATQDQRPRGRGQLG